MTESLRDQLMKAGFKPKPKPRPKAQPRPRGKAKRPAPGAGTKGRGKQGGDISLEAAYRAKEKAERRDSEWRKAEKIRIDAERKRQNDELQKLLADRALNDPEADQARHFQDGAKITRIYVTEQQRVDLAAEKLGIVKLRGRYLLVDAELAKQAGAIKPDAVIDHSAEADDGA